VQAKEGDLRRKDTMTMAKNKEMLLLILRSFKYTALKGGGKAGMGQIKRSYVLAGLKQWTEKMA
jgi:hypothetical protein